MKSCWRSKRIVVLGLIVLLSTSVALVSCRKAEEKVKEEVAYAIGIEEYVYGFPLVITEITRQVETAVPKAGELAAPINQFSRVRGIRHEQRYSVYQDC